MQSGTIFVAEKLSEWRVGLVPDRPAISNLDLAGVYEMASGTEHDIKQLNSLIEVTLDSAQGYMDAADEAKSSRFSTLFRERAAQRNEITGACRRG
jgi:hypothetical protein